MAEEKLPTRAEDFAEWYNQLVIKADLADYAPVTRMYGGQTLRLGFMGKYHILAG